MGVSETLVSELLESAGLAEDISNEDLRTTHDALAVKIRTQENRVNSIKTSLISKLQQFRRTEELAELARKTEDRFLTVKPLQSYDNPDVGYPDYDWRIVYANNKMTETSEATVAMIKEMNRLNDKLKQATNLLKKYKNVIQKVKGLLEETSGPSEVDLEKDRLRKRQIAEVLMLFQINQEYRRKTTDENGDRVYSEDPKIVRQLDILNQKFISFAEANAYFISGDLKLDLSDPGLINNTAELNTLIANLRLGYVPQKLQNKVKKYSQEMFKLINDPTASRNTSRLKEPSNLPKEGDSLSDTVSTTKKYVDFTQEATGSWITFNLPNLTKAIENSFLNKVSRANGGLPVCDKEPSEQEKKKSEALSAQDEAEEEAAEDLKQ